jgi:hypothetical protein
MLEQFQPRAGAGEVEALLRRAAIRSVGGGRCVGEVALTGQNMPANPAHSSAVRWSVLGALLAERGLQRVPTLGTLERELGKPIQLMIESVFGFRRFVDWKRYTVVDVLQVLNNWVTDEELELWWERAVKGAREDGL